MARNKFNVANYHSLVITRQFEAQKEDMNSNDMAAFWHVVREVEGFGFYNCGEFSGAR